MTGINWHEHLTDIKDMKKSSAFLLPVQGLYYFGLGLWPLVHATGFIQVTGAKTSSQLIKVTALFVICLGLTLIKGSTEKKTVSAIGVLASLSATSFLLVDICMVSAAQIYSVDCMIQSIFLLAWFFCKFRQPKQIILPRFTKAFYG